MLLGLLSEVLFLRAYHFVLMTLNSFDRISQPFRDYLTSRAGNYDYATARDLYADIPSELYGNENAMMAFLQGNETLGVEPSEWMHIVSEHNGGLDVPENLMLGPRSINRSIGSDNMTDANITDVTEANSEVVDILLDPENADILADTIQLGEAATTTAAIAANTVDVVEVADAAEAGLGEMIGEALVEGLVPAVFAGKAAMAVADQCDTPEDKLGWGAAAAGGTALLYLNPVTGPFPWGATAIYSGIKLAQLGVKLAPKVQEALK